MLNQHTGHTAISKHLWYNDLTGGFPDNTFRPDAQITRAQFASFLNRCLSLK
ncbi:S-layer homology domain-containing protein [Lysinibacillus fusiformis]